VHRSLRVVGWVSAEKGLFINKLESGNTYLIWNPDLHNCFESRIELEQSHLYPLVPHSSPAWIIHPSSPCKFANTMEREQIFIDPFKGWVLVLHHRVKQRVRGDLLANYSPPRQSFRGLVHQSLHHLEHIPWGMYAHLLHARDPLMRIIVWCRTYSRCRNTFRSPSRTDYIPSCLGRVASAIGSTCPRALLKAC
jgi:hypothetical protein